MYLLKSAFELANKCKRCYNKVREEKKRMIRSYFEDLRRLKEFRERRDLSIRTIAEETGLSQGAILRVKNLTMERISLYPRKSMPLLQRKKSQRADRV